MRILYLRGLNTYGTDDIRLGWLPLGSMIRPTVDLLREISQSYPEIEILAVEDLGRGTPEEMANRLILSRPELFECEFALLGQSAGGLVARVLMHSPLVQEHLRLVITMATPHAGAPAATQAISKMENPDRLTRFLEAIGYSMKDRKHIFESLTPIAMLEFNKKYPLIPAIPLHSMICELPFALRTHALHWWTPDEPADEIGDGFIPKSSQIFGQTHGPFYLDHLDSIGHHWHWRKAERVRRREEFKMMLSEALQLVRPSMNSADKEGYV